MKRKVHEPVWITLGWSESQFNALATYNAERSRGIVHTSEYDEKMASLQAEYDEKILKETCSNG